MSLRAEDSLQLRDLVDRHEGELRRHLVGMLPHEADADDVLQEVWLTLHRRPPDTGPGSNVRAWLYRVATNAALSRLSRRRRRCCALLGNELKVMPDALPKPGDSLDELSEPARVRLREHVAALPRKQREAVWLRWAEGLEYCEIAQALDSSEESARANVYQAMKRLRRELFDLWEKEG